MHDWVLVSVNFDWKSAIVEVHLTKVGGESVFIRARGVSRTTIPHREEWGPSIYVNRTTGPSRTEDGQMKFEIEMQSGDTIEIVASDFEIPNES